MKINYVPGLALRFFPGLSRELYDAVDDYIASNCKIAIFTGTAPTEQQVWDLSNFNEYVTANTDKLVYQETTQLKFTYDGYKHKRVIQRWPVDSTNITTLTGVVAQDAGAIAAGALETPNSLYALVYCPDKDTTLNTTGNDLVLFIPNVGSGATDFCSLSKTNFTSGENIYFRNLTVSLFQGYQITDTLINGEYEDPLNPGSMLTGPVDSKKSVYINKVWGNRISEAYRDCFISNNTFKVKATLGPWNYTVTTPNKSSYFNDNAFNGLHFPLLRKYDVTASTWTSNVSDLNAQIDKNPYFGYLVNQSLINLIDEINSKAFLNQLPTYDKLITTTSFNTVHRFANATFTSGVAEAYDTLDINIAQKDLIPAVLCKAIWAAHSSTDFLNSIKQLLIELGFDSGTVSSALKSIIPIGFVNTNYLSSFDLSSGVLTIQNTTPAKLKTRYKKSIHNPSNEQLYIFIPRFLDRIAIENPYGSNTTSNTSDPGRWFFSISSVSYPATQKVIDGEVVDNSTQRIRQQDYTAVSIGLTGNGETDLEYDLLDVIDYIDSFTTMVKIPNKF